MMTSPFHSNIAGQWAWSAISGSGKHQEKSRVGLLATADLRDCVFKLAEQAVVEDVAGKRMH